MVGRRVAKTLTAAFVRSAREPGRYFDGNGLFLRVEDSGSRAWIQRIYIRGKRSEMGLGSADLVSLAEAREAALANRKLARAGGDPLQAKREAKAVMTFEEAAREVHRLHSPTWRNTKHAAQFIASLETYAFERMGKLRIPDVTSADVLAVLTPIWTKKPETARRVRQRIGTVMKWSKAQGWRLDDPTDGVLTALPRHDTTQKQRKSLPYDKVADCLKAIHASGAGLSTKLALELAILTATRSGETRLATWDEFDLDKAVWLIPAERMKMKRAHRVPLSSQALAVLEQAKGLDDVLVFPGTKAGKPLSDMTLLKLVRELGFPVDVHGFRTSFRTWAQEKTDHPRELAEFALAHVVGDTAERAYARSDLFEKRRTMMEEWAKFLAQPNNEGPDVQQR